MNKSLSLFQNFLSLQTLKKQSELLVWAGKIRFQDHYEVSLQKLKADLASLNEDEEIEFLKLLQDYKDRLLSSVEVDERNDAESLLNFL